jgi:predicted PurR-regulated permease PerM
MDEYNDLNDYNEDILSTQILPKNDEGNQPNITNVDENTSLKEKEREKQISESDKKEKQRLIDIFANLREELEQDENKTIDQIYEDYANNDDTVKNNISKAFKSNWSKKGYKILLYFMFIIVLPFFTILNLIGTYQMLSFMNIFYDAIKNYVLCYFGWEDENEEYEFYNFYSYYFSESVNEGIDFDLMETMGFLGTILLNFSGFTVTSFFCLFINSVAAFFIFTFFNKYSGGKERYSAAQIIFLCFCYLLLFIGVGASALLSQQILIDNFYKFKLFLKENDAKKPSPNNIALEEEKEDKKEEEKEEEKEDEEDKKDISYFFLICTTSILGFFGKFILNYLILDAKYVFDKEYDANDAPNNISDLYDKMNDNETDNQINEIIFHHDRKLLSFTLIFIYGGSIVLSIIVYLLFGLIFDDTTNDEEDEENENPRICKLCGYTICSQKVKISFNFGFSKGIFLYIII